MEQKEQSMKIVVYLISFIVIVVLGALSVSAAEIAVDNNTRILTSTNVQTTTFLEIEKGVHVVNIEKEGIAITNIEITTNDNVSNAILTTTQLSEDLTGTLTPIMMENIKIETIYAYLQIEHRYLDNSNIDLVKIQFKVEKAWMTNNNISTNQIKLYRYTPEWDLLATSMISEDATHYYFESTSPGLSYFVIGSTTEATALPSTTTPTAPSNQEEPPLNQEETNQEDAVIQNDTNLLTGQVIGGNWLSSPWSIAAFVLLLLLIIAALIIATVKRPENKKDVTSARVTTRSNPFNEDDIRPVADLEGIGPEYKKILLAAKIEDTKQLWEANTAKLAERTGVPIRLVKSWQNMAELSCVEDIGPQYAELLERSGVHSIKQLKGYDAKTLLKLVRQKEKSLQINIQGNTPGLDLVKNWIAEAKKINTSYMK